MIRMLWVGLLVATTAVSAGCKKNKTEGDQGAVSSKGDTAGPDDRGTAALITVPRPGEGEGRERGNLILSGLSADAANVHLISNDSAPVHVLGIVYASVR